MLPNGFHSGNSQGIRMQRRKSPDISLEDAKRIETISRKGGGNNVNGKDLLRGFGEVDDILVQEMYIKGQPREQFEKQMIDTLIPQGLPHARFKVLISERKELTETGADSVSFLFSANKNGMLQTISQVASGGEISRVMLSVKALISGAVSLPTIIFDEIDTGVSGSIADRMAMIMQEMGAKGRQVISITHLPQIAARGKVHYKVYKQDTETETISHITRLDHDGRVEEIAHMLSGTSLTSEALENARVLLEGNVS